jgi:hypothetical protein
LIDTESDENVDKLKKDAKTLMWIYGLATGKEILPRNIIQDKDSFLTNIDEVSDENEIKELEKILNEYNQEDINEKYEKNILKNKNKENIKDNNYQKIDEEKEILNQIYEYNIRNSVLKKDIEQLEKEENSVNYIFKESNNNIFDINYNDKYKYEEKMIINEIKDLQNKNEYYINQIKEMENIINLKNNDIKEIQDEIENINKNIIDLENKNNNKKQYYFLKHNNYENINKLNELDEEIKNLLLIKEKLLNDYDNGIKKLNKIYNDKKGEIITESIDNETKEIMQENERLKEENNDIKQELNDLPNLKEEYDKLNQKNSKLKKELEKYSSHI